MISPSPSDVFPAELKHNAGHATLAAFALASDLVHLNHGSYGAIPKSVLAEQDRLRLALESDPTGFFQNIYPQRVREAAGIAAKQFGGAASEWAFCENATAAVNSVLGSLPLQPGDELLTTSHAYGAVRKAMLVWAARKAARVTVADVSVVVENETQVAHAVANAFTPRTRLLVIDHITSPTAILFPVREIVRLAHQVGIPVLVDGAHTPGQIPLDVTEIGADWYTGNAHKWLFAPRGCGLLWTAPRWQEVTRPAVLSHGSDHGYVEAFDWIGTRDVTPWLCLGAAVAAFQDFGAESLMARNRSLAGQGATGIVSRTGGTLTAPAAMRGAMAGIALAGHASAEEALSLRSRLRERGFVVAVNAFQQRLWLRVSAQIYNQASDYEALAAALNSLGFSAT